MTRTAHAGVGATLVAPVPALTDSICDELAVRISIGAGTGSAVEGGLDGQWVGRLRHIGAAKLRLWGLAALVDDAQLLISELVTNALRYGKGGEVEFRLVITLRGLLIAVDDGSAHRPRLSVAGAGDETGRGLYLVAAFADDWGVSPDGRATWCTLSVAGASR
ncbi:ATP-binding protein [Streptomyces sp. V4-01]|uniref:ATP-binding protein n=1 Tax=Actinacidiphila polyblastidii TaxID=3110430 RepID=A0ABU7PCG2_9ACTN|nr:ATP-binding protein [Streptomyces sp. V4-01]